jgi:hypothetical protein
MLDKNSEDLSSGKTTGNNENEPIKNENLKGEEHKGEVEKVGDETAELKEVELESTVEKTATEDTNEITVEIEKTEVEKVENAVETISEVSAIDSEVEVKSSENEITDLNTEKVEEDVSTPVEEEKIEVKPEDSTTEKVEEVSEEVEESATAKEVEKIPEKKKTKEEIPDIDLKKSTLEELAITLEKFLNDFSVNDIKDQFEAIKKEFNSKFSALVAAKKEEFIKEGGNEIDFNFSSPVKSKFGSLVKEYKKKRQTLYKEIEREQKQNLEKRLELIDELKDLIDNADASTMYKNFRAMQDEWRKVGQIPHTKYNDVWQTYHHHVERFYDLLHLNNDFRDLDFKHNLEEKTKLVEKAEELAEAKDVNHSFKELQILHRMWKEDIGPVARDVRDEIWDRFSEATKKIHDKRHELQNQLEAKYEKNVDLKIAVIDKIKAIKIDAITSHKLWQDNINVLEALREEFFAIGRVPKAKNEEIWQLFKDSTRKFNKAKNNFYKSVKNDQTDNLAKKLALVEQAESLKDSDDWDAVTEVFKKIQSDWKNIGHVPRKDSDKIWKRFKNACNHYFDRLHNKLDDANKGQVEVFNKKKELLDQFKEEVDKDDKLTLEIVNSYVNNWKELGQVPVKMRHIDSKFNKALDVAYKKLNLDKDEVALMKFKNIIDIYVAQNDIRKLDNEQLFIRRKVDEITKEIKQLENNISFISNATRDNPLVKNVYDTIDKHNKDLEFWQNKLSYLTSLNY